MTSSWLQEIFGNIRIFENYRVYTLNNFKLDSGGCLTSCYQYISLCRPKYLRLFSHACAVIFENGIATLSDNVTSL